MIRGCHDRMKVSAFPHMTIGHRAPAAVLVLVILLLALQMQWEHRRPRLQILQVPDASKVSVHMLRERCPIVIYNRHARLAPGISARICFPWAAGAPAELVPTQDGLINRHSLACLVVDEGEEALVELDGKLSIKLSQQNMLLLPRKISYRVARGRVTRLAFSTTMNFFENWL